MGKKADRLRIGYLGDEVVIVISQTDRETTIGHFASVETTMEVVLTIEEKEAMARRFRRDVDDEDGFTVLGALKADDEDEDDEDEEEDDEDEDEDEDEDDEDEDEQDRRTAPILGSDQGATLQEEFVRLRQSVDRLHRHLAELEIEATEAD